MICYCELKFEKLITNIDKSETLNESDSDLAEPLCENQWQLIVTNCSNNDSFCIVANNVDNSKTKVMTSLCLLTHYSKIFLSSRLSSMT
jgi:hypothetical protein